MPEEPKSQVATGFSRAFGGCFGLLAAIVVLIWAAHLIGTMDRHSAATLSADNGASAPTGSNAEPQWRTSTNRSKMDDSLGATISVDAKNHISGRFGESILPTLTIVCAEGKTDLYINWGVYLGLEETAVRYRIDSEKSITSNWILSTDNEATFSRTPIALIRRMVGKTTMIAETTPYGENTVEATFHISGLETPLQTVKKYCHWK